jgi:hypothetical protein
MGALGLLEACSEVGQRNLKAGVMALATPKDYFRSQPNRFTARQQPHFASPVRRGIMGRRVTKS